MLCIFCGKVAQFGANGELPMVCKLHSLDWMVNVSKQCIVPGCGNNATHGSKSKLHCADHKTSNIFNPNKCIELGCEDRAVYGFIRRPRTHCIAHKRGEMIKAKKICQEEGCSLFASFWDQFGNYCAAHKTVNMANLCKPVCKVGNCRMIAAFKSSGSCKNDICEIHMDEELLNMCKFPGCFNRACFGLTNPFVFRYTPEFCQIHKGDIVFAKPRAEKPNANRKRKLE